MKAYEITKLIKDLIVFVSENKDKHPTEMLAFGLTKTQAQWLINLLEEYDFKP